MEDEENETLRQRMHDLEATVRVGKGGISSVEDELRDQLEDRGLVKVKFLRSARGGTTTEELAAELADSVGAEPLRTRGHTAVYRK